MPEAIWPDLKWREMVYSAPLLDELRGRTQLSDLVGHCGVKLVRRGREFVGLCRFHRERTPSFTVWPKGDFFLTSGVNDIAATEAEGRAFVDELGANGVRAAFYAADDWRLVLDLTEHRLSAAADVGEEVTERQVAILMEAAKISEDRLFFKPRTDRICAALNCFGNSWSTVLQSILPLPEPARDAEG